MSVRSFFVATALFWGAPALACPGHPDCTSPGCSASVPPVDDDASEATPPSTEGVVVALQVTGMTCGACSSKITTALNETDGVLNATVDHTSGQAQIEIDNTQTTSATLIETINALGFTATAAE